MKRVVITGSAKGIGLALAELFLNKGWSVIGIDVDDCPVSNPNYTFIKSEVGAVSLILSHISTKVDLLINNAAIQNVGNFIDSKINSITDVIENNLLDTIKLTHGLLKKCLKSGSSIINVSSVHSYLPRTGKLGYDVSKAGLDMFTKTLALELAPDIRVNSINIGATYTPMNSDFSDPRVLEKSLNNIPLKHIFKPEEIARVIYNLTNDDFKFMTGSIIVYDAGRSLLK